MTMTEDPPALGPCPAWCPRRHPLEDLDPEPLPDDSGWVRTHELLIENPPGLPASFAAAGVYRQELFTLTDDGIETEWLAPCAWFWATDGVELDVHGLDLLAELVAATRAALVAVRERGTAP
jgi:hypothetical protein